MFSSYDCDCEGTGFVGGHCEEDIPECASDPCQHGSTCLEGINQYQCLCWPGTPRFSDSNLPAAFSVTETDKGGIKVFCLWPGYDGEHCQVDIDECEPQPCENGGECFQRSDILNYRKLPELTAANFTYEEAAGFICRCPPGFTGRSVCGYAASRTGSESVCSCRRRLLS